MAPADFDRDAELLKRIDALHTDVKAIRVGHADLDKRLAIAEHHDEDADKQLKAGAESFTRIKTDVEALKMTVAGPKWRTIIAAALIVGAWVWYASRLPGPEKYEDVSKRVQAVELDQRDTKAAIENIRESQSRTERKVDTLLTMTRSTP